MKKSILRFALFGIMAGICGSVQAQNIYTYAGVPGSAGYSGDGSYAELANIRGPRGIVTDHSGNAYFCDAANNVVRKVTTNGIISTVAGNGTAGYSGDGAAATAAQLAAPSGIAIDAAGNLYIADANNDVIRKVTTAGIISTIVGNGTAGYTGDGAAATLAQLTAPLGVAVDASGNIYIADTRNYAIREVVGGIINTIVGSGTTGYTGDGGPATAATVSRVSGIAVDASGNIYVADRTNEVIRKIAAGVISTVAGIGTAGYSGDGAAATAAQLNNPYGVAVDASGNLFIADYTNSRVRKVTAGIINTIGGTGVAGYSGDGGAATSAELRNPIAVCLDVAGNIYISDNGNSLIRRIGAPVTSITITTPHGDTICTGTTVHFLATAYADTHPHYMWQLNGATVGTDSMEYSSSSLVTGDLVKCILLDSAGIDSIAISATLRVISAPVVSAITGPNITCVGGNLTLRDSVRGGQWIVNDTLVATVRPPARIVGVGAGTATVFYVVSNVCGADTASLPITVVLNTTGPITGPASVCAGDTVDFTDITTGGLWRTRPPFGFGGATGTIDSVTGVFIAGTTPGMVYINYGTIPGPGCGSIDSIMIDSMPVVSPITGPSTVNSGLFITLTDATLGGTWSSQNASIATVNSATGMVGGVAPGVVAITYSVSGAGGCTAYQVMYVTVDSTTGVQNVQNNSGISIFPNPASGSVTLAWQGQHTGSGNVVIADVTGREVYNNEILFIASTGRSLINLTSLKAGVYMISVKSDYGYYCSKLVIE